ncbi:MAG: Hsp20/alpha crystallin family protein [Kiritimatiellia bacterium]
MFELTTWPRSAWSIFDELESLQESMNRALRNTQPNADYRGERYPLLNVWTSPDGLLVEADMPGVDPADVDIDLVGDELTISGKVNATAEGENVVVHRQERPHGEFARKLKLPFRVDNNNVSAAFRNGVLRVKLPRSEEEKPRKIAVQAA